MELTPSIASIAARGFPVSHLKNRLRQLPAYYKLWASGIKFDKQGDIVTIVFPDGALRGQEIRYPYNRPNRALASYRELPSYFVKQTLNEGDVVLDCGAFPGDYSIIASRIIGSRGKVFAFEPDPTNRSYLKETLALNCAQNVEVVPLGLDMSSGRELFTMTGGSSRFARFREGKNQTEVRTISLDDLDGRVDAIKMDIECAELAAVMGGRRLLTKQHPNLMIASYHQVDGRQSFIELEKLLPTMGYTNVETIHHRHMVTYATTN
jgi:FkbM family methyltransferase